MEYNEALKLLKLNEGFTDKELKKSYLKMSKVYHPDLNGDEEMMKKINEARDVLANETSIYVTKSSINYQEELVNRLKNKLAYASVDDINYIKINKVIKDFINIDIDGNKNIDLYQEYIKAESKIMDIYFEIKRDFYKRNKIPKSFVCTINFTGSLIDLYNDLNKTKKKFDNYICNNILINNIDKDYYEFLKDKINDVIKSIYNKYYDTKSIEEIINIINNKVNYMYVIYEDSLNIIKNISNLIDKNNDYELREIINKEISSMNKDYYNNYGRLNELLVSVGLKYGINLRKNIKVKEFICNNYNDNIILRKMLLDIYYVNIGLISEYVINIMLKRKYSDLNEYNDAIYEKLNKRGIVYVNNKLISNSNLSIGVITYKNNNKVYINGLQYDQEYFFKYYETLEIFLRDSIFIGELVNNYEVLLYTNNITAIYLIGDEIEVRLYDKKRGIKFNHIDIDKYSDKIIMRDKLLNYLIKDEKLSR